MKKYLFGCVVALSMTMLCIISEGQGVSTYQVSNPYISTAGSFAGTLAASGYYTNPYYSATRSVSNVILADTMTQKIVGWQFGVAAQFTYTRVGIVSPYGAIITTEASCDTGSNGNYSILYTDSVKNVASAQTFSHVVYGWPYSNIRLRYSGTNGTANTGTWKGVLIIR
jgi:hypothetical protein